MLAIARKSVRIKSLLVSEDTEIMSNALGTCDAYDFYNPKPTANTKKCTRCFGGQHELYIGNSGTSARFLSPVLSFCNGTYLLHGTSRMHNRPVAILHRCLRTLGANLQSTRSTGGIPTIIRPSHTLPGFSLTHLEGNISSQFITATFFGAKLQANNQLTGIVISQAHTIASRSYIRMTLLLMERFGLIIERYGWKRYTTTQSTNQTSVCRTGNLVFNVSADFTSTSYFIASGLVGYGWLIVTNASIFGTQGDAVLVSILRALGLCVWASRSNLAVIGSRRALGPVWLSCGSIPDVTMTIATLMAFVGHQASHFGQLLTWRFKETDRMLALAMELRKFQQTIECSLDSVRLYFHSTPKAPRNKPIRVRTYQDHRIAMCCSVLCFMGHKIRVEESDCINKTFPDFFHTFNSLTSKS